MDIDGWLRGIGLAQYAEMFRANDIDGELLGRLTNDDLKDIGVASFGHRKKLLEAIAELGSAPARERRRRAGADPGYVAPPPISASAEAAGERRYLTVMFCDLVGSTGIAARLDAEEWRDLVGAYLDAASAAVTEMGGHVAKKLGDGLMALFGYPVAQENDAERAARAALAIQRALAELNRKNAGTGKPALTARIGLETGPVVVDAAGEIYRRRRQHRGAGAGAGRAGRGSGHGAGAAPGRRPVRRRGARHACAQGRAGADGAVPAGAGERRRTPFGAAQSHAARRPRRGNGDADAALGAGAAGRRATGDDRRRAGAW